MNDKILNIIKGIRPDIEISQSTRLITDDILDSLDVIKLVAELDEEFNISIDGVDIIPENLDTLSSIEDTVRRYHS